MSTHTFSTDDNPALFLEQDDGSGAPERLAAGSTVLVRNADDGTPLDSTTALDLGYLSFTTTDVQGVQVSGDNGATWKGPFWSKEAREAAVKRQVDLLSPSGVLVAGIVNPVVDTHLGGDATGLVTDVAGIKPGNGKRAVGKDELVINALDYGATGDGVTVDGVAISSALTACSAAGGGVVLLPVTGNGYLAGGLTIPSGVTLRGGGPGTVLKKNGTSAEWIKSATNAKDVGIENLTINDNGTSTSYMFEVLSGGSNVHVSNCTFIGASQGIETRGGTSNIRIRDCSFQGLATGIRVNLDPSGVWIQNCTFAGWKNRAIQVLGSTVAVSNLWILDNLVEPHASDAGTSAVRQPIQFSSGSVPFTGVHVRGNTVIGLGTSFTDPTTPGSADLISLHGCDGFDVIGNYVINGGDVGITVAQQCKNGTIVGNVSKFNDSCGIFIGSGTSDFTDNLAISANTCTNNGQNRQGTTPSGGGIRLQNAHFVAVSGNLLGDDQTTATQQYGVYLSSCDNIHMSANVDAGNTTSLYGDLGSNTNCTKNAAAVAL